LGDVLGDGDARSQTKGNRERQECEGQKAMRLEQITPGRMHESVMIRGGVPGSNRTRGASKIGRVG